MTGSKTDLNKTSTRGTRTTSPEELRKMIAETAYYLAEQRGFEGGCQLHDWLEAEARIRRIHGKAV